MDAIAGFCGCPRHEQKRFRNVKDHYLHKKGTVPKDSPLWRIVLNSEQMGCNPASAFELYPVITVSSAVDAFAICVADVAFVQVVHTICYNPCPGIV